MEPFISVFVNVLPFLPEYMPHNEKYDRRIRIRMQNRDIGS
jgi:hypothetical protein